MCVLPHSASIEVGFLLLPIDVRAGKFWLEIIRFLFVFITKLHQTYLNMDSTQLIHRIRSLDQGIGSQELELGLRLHELKLVLEDKDFEFEGKMYTYNLFSILTIIDLSLLPCF